MNKYKIKEVLFTKELTKKLIGCPPENEAAKLYHKFLLDHPEYENDDSINCQINSEEREEDHYGNGGGIYYTLIIYKWREETDTEYNKRIEELENNLIKEYSDKFNEVLRELNYKIRDIPSITKEKIIYFIQKNIDLYINTNF